MKRFWEKEIADGYIVGGYGESPLVVWVKDPAFNTEETILDFERRTGLSVDIEDDYKVKPLRKEWLDFIRGQGEFPGCGTPTFA